MLQRLQFILVALAACVVLIACAPDESSPLKNVSGLLPDLKFTMTDDTGHTVSARDYRGDIVLVFFGFTSCMDVCPLTMARLEQALSETGSRGQGMRVLFVTVDPARDTIDRLHGYVNSFGPEFVGLRGSANALRDLAKRYRVVYSQRKPDGNGDYAVVHSGGVFVFDQSGRARYLVMPDDPPSAITAGLDRLVAQAGESAAANHTEAVSLSSLSRLRH
jgi:protein SCO1/2